MSRYRRFPGEDMVYSQAHRAEMAWHYRRLPGIGHRTKMINRDWTEYCAWCFTPLAFIEEVRWKNDRQFEDKPFYVTRNTAELAHRPAFLLGYQDDRPDAVQARIDALNAEVRELEAQYPITGFRARCLTPLGRVVPLTPGEWWSWVYLLHREHHAVCSRANGHEFPVEESRMRTSFMGHPLNADGMAPLFGPLIRCR